MPIEIKTGIKPRYPYFSHIVQIGVYSLLVEDLYGHCQGGVLRYGDKTFFIKLNEKLRATIKENRNKLLKDLQKGSMHRNHRRRGKCKKCSMREKCPDAQVWQACLPESGNRQAGGVRGSQNSGLLRTSLWPLRACPKWLFRR